MVLAPDHQPDAPGGTQTNFEPLLLIAFHLFKRTGPVLKSMVPGHKPEPSVLELKRWVRTVVRVWVLVVVPILLLNVGMILLNLPRLVGTAWDSGQAGRRDQPRRGGHGAHRRHPAGLPGDPAARARLDVRPARHPARPQGLGRLRRQRSQAGRFPPAQPWSSAAWRWPGSRMRATRRTGRASAKRSRTRRRRCASSDRAARCSGRRTRPSNHCRRCRRTSPMPTALPGTRSAPRPPHRPARPGRPVASPPPAVPSPVTSVVPSATAAATSSPRPSATASASASATR